MTTHTATISWSRNDQSFGDRMYSRRHQWSFDGGATIDASSSPHVVRAPLSDPTCVDPEEAYIAALSSCHMLWFLDLAAQAGWIVNTYVDHATGHMATRDDGKVWVERVELTPAITFSGPAPDAAALAALHHAAHASCFLANSVKTSVIVQ